MTQQTQLPKQNTIPWFSRFIRHSVEKRGGLMSPILGTTGNGDKSLRNQ